MGGLPHRFQTIQKFAGWPESSAGRSQWSTLDISRRRRRVVAKAEWTQGEASPRFVVTSLKRSEAGARHLYEDISCARGDKSPPAPLVPRFSSPPADPPIPVANQLAL